MGWKFSDGMAKHSDGWILEAGIDTDGWYVKDLTDGLSVWRPLPHTSRRIELSAFPWLTALHVCINNPTFGRWNN